MSSNVSKLEALFWFGGFVFGFLVSYLVFEFDHDKDEAPLLKQVATLEAKVIEHRDLNAELSLQVGPLEREVTSLRQSLATCQGAQAGIEASLEDFYQELMFAHRFDMVVFDEDGQARRLVFDCGGDEK